MMTTIDTAARPADAPQEVLTLLREQIPLYTKLESHASRQRSLITGDDTSSLLSLLADRQRISADLARIASRLEPIRRDWGKYRKRLTPEQRDQAERLLTEIRERLARVIENDEQDARLLAARKQAVAETLRATHSTEQALSAYRTPAGKSDRFDHWDEAT
jgi:ElaB/YqjD/DUF883 family membrane-anchored ribosome-binding protein